jgi:hypothetical protein
MRPLVELLQDPKILAIIAAHLVAGYYLMKALSKYEPLFTKKEVDTLFSKVRRRRRRKGKLGWSNSISCRTSLTPFLALVPPSLFVPAPRRRIAGSDGLWERQGD